MVLWKDPWYLLLLLSAACSVRLVKQPGTHHGVHVGRYALHTDQQHSTWRGKGMSLLTYVLHANKALQIRRGRGRGRERKIIKLWSSVDKKKLRKKN